MISGRTFAREMIALRQRETKRAGRILALQGQNPGQLELRTHSEFGANLSVTPGGFAFLCLRAIPRRSSPAGYHSLRLRPAKTKPQYLLLQPAMPPPPGTKDSYKHPTTPSAGRTVCVLTCLTKSPHKIENGQSHPCFTHFLLHYYELKIISLPITLHYAISHGLAPRIFHSHL